MTCILPIFRSQYVIAACRTQRTRRDSGMMRELALCAAILLVKTASANIDTPLPLARKIQLYSGATNGQLFLSISYRKQLPSKPCGLEWQLLSATALSGDKPYLHYMAPRFLRTAPTVLKRSLKSKPMDQLQMYSVSSLTTSSKSVISLRPLTCHMPVMPGFMARRAR